MAESKQESIVRIGERRGDAVLKHVLSPCGLPGGPAARLVEAGLKPELMEGELRGGNAIQTSVKVEERIYFFNLLRPKSFLAAKGAALEATNSLLNQTKVTTM